MAFEIWKYTRSIDNAPSEVTYETSMERLVNAVWQDVQAATTTISVALDKVSAEEIF